MLLKRHTRRITMKSTVLFLAIVLASLGNVFGQATAPSSNQVNMSDWTASSEYVSLFDTTEPLFAHIKGDTAKTVRGLPEWILNTRITDPKQLDEVSRRLEPLYKAFPKTREIEIVLFANPFPYFALGGNNLLVVSDKVVEITNAEEFRASTAHELGHLFFAEKYVKFAADKDYKTIQQIEMNCDAVALILLQKMNDNPKGIGQALKKIYRAATELRREQGKEMVASPMYPDIDTRLDFLAGLRKRNVTQVSLK